MDLKGFIATKGRRIVGLLALLCVCMTASGNPPEQPVPEPEVVRAAALLDGRYLRGVRGELDAALKRNPESAPAYREYARYYIMSGETFSRQFEPGSLEAALGSVDRAIALAPQYANAHVLRGHVLTLMDRLDEADAALDRASAIGTDDPWLSLNRANLRLDQGRPEEAAPLCRQVSEQSGVPRIRDSADTCLIKYFRATNQREHIDAVFQRMLTYASDSAWTHGDYAGYLLCFKDDAQGAAREARAALGIMDHGNARANLAAALYRIWSAQWESQQGKADERLFDEASALVRAPAAEVITGTCTGGPGVITGLSVLYLSGRLKAETPADAIQRAIGADNNGTPGVFAVEVQGTGRDTWNVYANSLADYRDPASLTVRFAKPAAQVLAAKHGQPLDALLRGKRIVVAGYVRRERIAYRANGVETGKYYYQTHLWVTDPGQLLQMSDAVTGQQPQSEGASKGR